MTTTTTYLAIYTGPSGPISATFEATTRASAIEHVADHGDRWYDDGADCLDLDPDSETINEDILDALASGGWELEVEASNNAEYSIYTAPLTADAQLVS